MSPRRTRYSRTLVAALSAAVAICLAVPVGAPADTPAGGIRGHKYGSVDDPPTATKPESKLWFNDGWWADMLDAASRRHHIFRFDRSAQGWVDTGVEVDPRPDAHADTLWDAGAGKLYVASHAFSEDASSSTSSPGRLWRFSYDRFSGYTLDPGFPVAINEAKTESLVIAKDSTGTLWATWMEDDQISVNRTTGDDAVWATPYVLPGTQETSGDDLSSAIAFGGNRIGVMWSNEDDGKFHFAVHVDGSGDGDWSTEKISGMPLADDHINLKADGAGRVYAAVKHTEDARHASDDDPFASLLVRSASGTWTRSTIAKVSEHVTRPIVLLDEQHQVIHTVYTGGQSGGDIREKVSPMSSLSFGNATTLIEGSDLNNATSTKQNVDGGTGLVVLASDSSAYYYVDRSLGAPPAPPPSPAGPPPGIQPPYPAAPPASSPRAPAPARRRCKSKASVARKRKASAKARRSKRAAKRTLRLGPLTRTAHASLAHRRAADRKRRPVTRCARPTVPKPSASKAKRGR